jgi:hypothetical protein
MAGMSAAIAMLDPRAAGRAAIFKRGRSRYGPSATVRIARRNVTTCVERLARVAPDQDFGAFSSRHRQEQLMSSTLAAKFNSRREAEMTVERLVQEFQIERTDIFITTEGDQNSAGTEPDGADVASATPTSDARDDAALTGRIVVSVDVQDDAKVEEVRRAFGEFDGG